MCNFRLAGTSLNGRTLVASALALVASSVFLNWPTSCSAAECFWKQGGVGKLFSTCNIGYAITIIIQLHIPMGNHTYSAR